MYNREGRDQDGLTSSITLEKRALGEDECKWWKVNGKAVSTAEGVAKWCWTSNTTRSEGQHHGLKQRLVKEE